MLRENPQTKSSQLRCSNERRILKIDMKPPAKHLQRRTIFLRHRGVPNNPIPILKSDSPLEHLSPVHLEYPPCSKKNFYLVFFCCRENRRHFEMFSIRGIIQGLLHSIHSTDNNSFLLLNLKSILFNLTTNTSSALSDNSFTC